MWSVIKKSRYIWSNWIFLSSKTWAQSLLCLYFTLIPSHYTKVLSFYHRSETAWNQRLFHVTQHMMSAREIISLQAKLWPVCVRTCSLFSQSFDPEWLGAKGAGKVGLCVLVGGRGEGGCCSVFYYCTATFPSLKDKITFCIQRVFSQQLWGEITSRRRLRCSEICSKN